MQLYCSNRITLFYDNGNVLLMELCYNIWEHNYIIIRELCYEHEIYYDKDIALLMALHNYNRFPLQ